MYSLDAMYLMSATVLTESKLTHLKQIPQGPALGFAQVEWETYLDIKRYLQRRTDIAAKLLAFCERESLPENPATLISDMALNCCIARLKYWMDVAQIPSYKDALAQYNYYKRVYNTNMGLNTAQEFVRNVESIKGIINHEST
jgi:hypothetical protein